MQRLSCGRYWQTLWTQKPLYIYIYTYIDGQFARDDSPVPRETPQCMRNVWPLSGNNHLGETFQGAQKERRRGRAEKRLSKRVLLESPFLLCPLGLLLKHLQDPENLKGAEKKRTLQNTLLDTFLRTTPSPLLWRAPNIAKEKVEATQTPVIFFVWIV